MKTDLFQSRGHCWVFQIYWHIECSTFAASFFRIWNSSTEIPSPPLALFIVMLSKAYLTSHSRMYGSRWVITPSWLSGSWRSFFVQFFCVFLPRLLNKIPNIFDFHWLPFWKPTWTFGSSWFTYCWSLAWRILSITLLVCAAVAAAAKLLQSCPTLYACKMSAIVW